jgi:tetratricopeptide (TPR) repeat protein
MRSHFPAVCLTLCVSSIALAADVEELAVAPRVVKVDKVVAWVRHAPIYEWEVLEAVCRRPEFFAIPDKIRTEGANELYRLELRELVERELILDAYFTELKQRKRPTALRNAMAAASNAADDALRSVQSKNDLRDENAMRDLFAASGITIAGLRRYFEREFLKHDYVQQRLVPKRDAVGTAELTDYYEKHPEQFLVEDSVKWQDLFVRKDRFVNDEDAKTYAEWLLQRAKHEEFAKLIEFDDGIARWSNGFGFGARKGEINPPELEQTIFALEQGEVAIVHFETGYHIVRVAQRTLPGKRAFSNVEVRREIRERLESEVWDREYRRLVDSLWDDAKTEMVFQGDSLEPQIDAGEYRRLANCFWEKGAPIAAKGAAKRLAFNEREKTIGALFTRGGIYERNGDHDEAVSAYSEIIRIDPKNPNAFKARGLAYRDKEQLTNALIDFCTALELAPADPEAISLRAAAADKDEDFNRAIADLTQMIEVGPDNVHALLARGGCYARLLYIDNAIADFSEAIDCQPNLPVGFVNRADCYAWKEEIANAIADYTEAIRLNPTLTSALQRRADCYFKTKEYRKAYRDYSETLRLDADNWQALASLARLLSITPIPDLRNAPEAVRQATKACQLTDWQKPGCLTILAAAYAECGEFKKAAKWESKAIELGFGYEIADQQSRLRLEAYKQGKLARSDGFDE